MSVIRPSRDTMLMDMAIIVANRGTCERAQVGVVIAHEGRVLGTGYNGAPSGMPHCDHTKVTDIEGCRNAVHAEANAIAYAARYGVAIQDSELFTTLSPCMACCQLIINTGIKRVVYMDMYRITEGLDLLVDAGITVTAFVPDDFSGEEL